MQILTGRTNKLFGIVFKRYNANNLINIDELRKTSQSPDELDEDIQYLISLGLIKYDYGWNLLLTPRGRTYYRDLFWQLFLNIIFPAIISILTTLLTLWSKRMLRLILKVA